MDVVQFFEDLTEAFNDEQKCDTCWNFAAPLFADTLNAQKVPQQAACCVQTFVTALSKNTVKGYAPTTGLLNSHVDDYTFTVYFVKLDDIGTNVHTEMPGHDVAQSKWATIYKPLQDCLSDTEVLRMCDILGYRVRVTLWNMTLVKNMGDHNLSGWQVRGTFREQVI